MSDMGVAVIIYDSKRCSELHIFFGARKWKKTRAEQVCRFSPK